MGFKRHLISQRFLEGRFPFLAKKRRNEYFRVWQVKANGHSPEYGEQTIEND